MEENKEIMEQTVVTSEEITEQNSIAEPETLSVEADKKTENIPEKQNKENAASWGKKNVTRKFMVIALAAAVVLNAAVTSGISGALLKKQTAQISGMNGKGHARNEMHFDKNPKDRGKRGPSGREQNTEQDQKTDQNQETSSKASIGITIKEDSGIVVAQITGENAKKAGFKEGDKIVSVEGKNVTTGNDLISEVQSHKAGDTITVTVERDGQNIEIKTELE